MYKYAIFLKKSWSWRWRQSDAWCFYMAQGIVVTYLRCGGIYSKSVIANFLLILSVKEFWKLFNIWWSYQAYKNGASFLAHPVRCPNISPICHLVSKGLHQQTISFVLKFQVAYSATEMERTKRNVNEMEVARFGFHYFRFISVALCPSLIKGDDWWWKRLVEGTRRRRLGVPSACGLCWPLNGGDVLKCDH